MIIDCTSRGIVLATTSRRRICIVTPILAQAPVGHKHYSLVAKLPQASLSIKYTSIHIVEDVITIPNRVHLHVSYDEKASQAFITLCLQKGPESVPNRTTWVGHQHAPQAKQPTHQYLSTVASHGTTYSYIHVCLVTHKSKQYCACTTPLVVTISSHTMYTVVFESPAIG